MFKIVTDLLDTGGFPARWYCGRWSPAQGWLHILSDLAIWSAYLAIPCVLIYYASRRRNLPYKSIFFLFGAFIFSCGTTHLLDAIIFWWPAYRLAGLLKLVTAIISWATVIALAHVAPKAFALRSPEELQREIDGRKKMEELADAMPQMAWMAHANGHAYWHNKRWYDFTGTTPEQMEGLGWQRVYPPEVVPKLLERWSISVATGEVFEMVLPMRGPDGQYRSVLARTVPIRSPDGSIQRWFGTATDITDRVQLEQRLSQSHTELEERVRQRTLELSQIAKELRCNEQRYRSLVEATTAVVWNTTASGTVESDLIGWAAFTGQTQEQIRGTGWLDAIHPDDRARTADVWSAAVAGKQLYRTEYRLRTAAGEYRDMMVRGVPVFDEDGAIREWVGTCTDITEQRRQEAAAEAASRAKSDFLTNMSHEIRTPMTAIVGFSELLLQPVQTLSEKQDALQVIRRNARHLLDLINDVLDLSKIEAGKMVTCRTTTDLVHTLADVASMMRSRAAEKGLGFRVRFQGPIPRKIQTDPLRLRQILVNLLANAIKFTANGEVRLVVSCPNAGPGSEALGKDVRFDIADTGIGMTAEQMARLFQQFTQADESTTRKFGGSGLGLGISKRLAQLLGGDITVQSIFGAGSTFTLTIDGSPLEDVETIADAAALLLGTSVETAGLEESKIAGHVLLAEDGADNQRLIRHLLERAGAKVTIAENGRLAVDKARAEPFDLILMDMQMPELDGYGASSELRRRGIKIPIIALTAHAMSDDREKCIAAGCTDYLTKPLDTGLLLKTVCQYLPQGPQTQPSAVVQPASAGEPTQAPEALTAIPVSIKSRFRGNAGMIEVIDQFVAALPQRVSELLRLIESNSLTELRLAVHRLKGAGGSYGFTPISEFSARAEQLLKDELSVDAARSAIQELVELIRRVEGYDRALETAQISSPTAA